jgi:hypothetical protein
MPLNDSLKEYDPKEVIVTWSGVPLNAGIVDGTFLTVKRNVSMWKLFKGGDGEGARVRASNHSGTFEITTRTGSEIHQILAVLANTDLLTGVVVAPLLVLDFSGRTLHAGNRAFITNMPEDTFATQEESRTWIFEADTLFMFPGGSKDVKQSNTTVGFSGLTTPL